MLRNARESVKIRVDDNSATCHDLASVALEAPSQLLPRTRKIAAIRETGRCGGAVGLRPVTESESKLLPTDSLNALSKPQLISLLRRKPCVFDDMDLYRLTLSTIERLKRLRQRAREGKCVEEAAEFAHWVTASGLVKLCEGEDKADLLRLVSDTLADCGDTWRTEGRNPWVAKSELEALNAKVDNLATLLAASLARNDSAEPGLAVMEGGAS